MPKSPTGRTASRISQKSTPPATEREPRGARRKRETRSRLLDAALHLMSEKGMEGVAINEITEAADVGLGSFYNHFESKEAIYSALMDWVFEEFADTLNRLVRDVADPAEVISVCVRHVLLRARREPVWGHFLVREGLSTRPLGRGLGQGLLRDIQKGVATKRFTTNDPFVTFICIGGAVLASISAELQVDSPQSQQTNAIKTFEFSGDGLAERVAAVILNALGLDQAEADAIARCPLPIVEIKS
jgi:AcrR family transcriptional regulator